MEPRRCTILIVGAGLAGAATAYHLRRAGMTDVVLLEKEAVPGVHASGRNAAMVREQMDSPELRALAAESTAVLRTGDLAEFHATGGFLMGAALAAGPTTEAKDYIPCARGTGHFQPLDGVIDVAALLQHYLEGQVVHYDTAFESWGTTDDGLLVQTSRGPFRAAILVNAAGPWAGEVGDVALRPYNRHLFVSAHDPLLDRQWPFLWDLEHGYYVRPESGGWLLCACDEHAAAPGDYTQDPAVLEDLGHKLRRHQPGLGNVRIARQWVGQRTFAADRLPVIGFDPRCPQLFHVAGLGGHGVTLSWAVGRHAALAITGNGADGAATAFDPARLLSARASS